MTWPFPIVRVSQKDDHGCGIACVATVCGVTYERARHEFFPHRKQFRDNKSIHVDSEHMQRVIHRLGFKSKLVGLRSVTKVDSPAIMVFSWLPFTGRDDLHGVVWDPFKQRIIDPGYDHDYDHPSDFYFNLWKQSGFATLVVTGKM